MKKMFSVIYIYIYIYIYKINNPTYYQKNKEEVLNKAEDYYQNDKESLESKQAINIKTYLRKRSKN